MKHLCYSKIFLLIVLFVSQMHASSKSAIVYYGDDISYSNVGTHDYIIVEPNNVSTYSHGFKMYKDKIYSYISVGEVSEDRFYFKDIKDEWLIAENKLWNSKVLDISNDEYHEFLYKNVIESLIKKGHKNFFLDTLDSYQLASSSKDKIKEYELGLIRFIKKFKHRYPNSKLIINRGFEVIDEVHESIEAVLFESLFYGLSSKDLSYKQVSDNDRKWLLLHVEKIKSYGLDVIALDYIDVNDKTKIKQTIRDIESLNIIPYISNKELTRYGNSSKKVVKREILVLYNSSYKKQNSNAHLMGAMPIEYLGYIPILKDLKENLPDKNELTRYAGVIVWLENNVNKKDRYEKWIKTVINSGVKLLFLDGFGLTDDTEVCNILDIKTKKNPFGILQKNNLTYNKDIVGFELNPINIYSPKIYNINNSENFLVVTNKLGQKNIAIAKTKWGGYVLNDFVKYNFKEDYLWLVNPFELFKKTLELQDIPVPDVTTGNGRRLLFSHIDGDASMNRAEWDIRKYSIDIMYENILKKYKIPQSVSIVEAELNNLYPKDSSALQSKAKEIYKLPYVEAATHTYTHPFNWGEVKDDNLDKKYRLKVKNYNFSIDREIKGSLSFINNKLLPKGKKKANTVYWTGDCFPKKSELEYVYKNNLLNINGGQTVITNDKPWLSLVAPYGIKRGEYHQVYTGTENENVYTNEFRSKFWGYEMAIQTFKLTNSPRRLKPIDIYYHFYAASKDASLEALTNVYIWALKQDTMPIYTSEFIPKVMELYDVSISKIDENWHFEGMKELKTLRLSKNFLHVDFKNSKGIIGERKSADERYIHLNTNVKDIDLYLKKNNNENSNYIVDTNGKIEITSKNNMTFKIKSYVELDLNYHLKNGCEIISNPKTKHIQNGFIVNLKFDVREAKFEIKCK